MPKTFCVVGHDARQHAAARVLRRAGYGVTAADNAAAADYILLPMSQGRVSDEVARALQGAGQGTLILAGRPGMPVRMAAREAGLPLIDYFLRPELECLNAVPTVAARSPEQRANARCAGCRAAPLTALPTLLPGFDAVINTVPAPVLPRALLQQLPGGALIIDLASLPGGTDFAAAEELGLHAEHALALPGRCAPQTTGALIAQTVLAILEERDPDERSTAP
uniref:dipicolinic acid synthetase n=1 Tax=Gemmiger formicilis TaxID=745368 RepID=UPI003FF10EED